MKSKLKIQNGITLVALVITIIVLLILAMVSIKIAMDGGLTKKASEATSQHTIAAQKEAIQTGYAAYQVELAKNSETATLTIEGNPVIETTTDGWKITFDTNSYKLYQNGNIELLNAGNGQEGTDTNVPTEDLAYLRKEMLGENGGGKKVEDIATCSGSWYYYNTIEFNNKKIKSLNVCDSGYNYPSLVIEYNNSVYILKMGESYTLTESVEFAYKKNENSKEGKKVDYSYDGTEENKKEWTVLYDNGDTLEIISPEAIGNLTLGKYDSEAQGNTDSEKTIYSYNHAIDRINNYTASLVTNSNKISVRSVGSNPNNPNYRNTTKYDWNGNISEDGIFEGTDNNREYDIARISYFNIAGANENYWSASRQYQGYCSILIHYYSSSGIAGNRYIASGRQENMDSYNQSFAVRPVVKVATSSVQIKN